MWLKRAGSEELDRENDSQTHGSSSEKLLFRVYHFRGSLSCAIFRPLSSHPRLYQGREILTHFIHVHIFSKTDEITMIKVKRVSLGMTS